MPPSPQTKKIKLANGSQIIQSGSGEPMRGADKMPTQSAVKPTHTPTPWSIDAMGYLRGPESENILENHDNAALIVRAVNAHEELVEGLRQLAIETDSGSSMADHAVHQCVMRILAKAEGKD